MTKRIVFQIRSKTHEENETDLRVTDLKQLGMGVTPLITALGRKKQADHCTKTAWSMEIVQGQPELWRNLV